METMTEILRTEVLFSHLGKDVEGPSDSRKELVARTLDYLSNITGLTSAHAARKAFLLPH